MNKVIISGNLCQEINVKYTKNNVPVISNTLAVRNEFKNAEGKYDSQFINIVIWNKTAEFVQKYCTKGSKILVEGRLETRQYDDPERKACICYRSCCRKIRIIKLKTKYRIKKRRNTL